MAEATRQRGASGKGPVGSEATPSGSPGNRDQEVAQATGGEEPEGEGAMGQGPVQEEHGAGTRAVRVRGSRRHEATQTRTAGTHKVAAKLESHPLE